MYKAQKGFTLIELVVVITILGILAAFAFPRFASLEIEARAATVDGLAGSLRSGSALAHSMELVGAVVVMEGNTITMVNGYPAGGVIGGIPSTLVDYTGFTVAYTAVAPMTATFEKTGGNLTTCTVVYTEALPAGSPSVVADNTAC